MSDDRHEAVHEATRRAVTAWIAKGDDKAGKALRDCLHALAGGQGTRRELGEKPGRPKRRKAAYRLLGA